MQLNSCVFQGVSGLSEQREHHAADGHRGVVPIRGSPSTPHDAAALGHTPRDAQTQQGCLPKVSVCVRDTCVTVMQ